MRADVPLQFAGLPLDRLGERRDLPLEALREGATRELEIRVDADGHLVLAEDGPLGLSEPIGDRILLGRVEDALYFGRTLSAQELATLESRGARRLDLRAAAMELDPFAAGLAAYTRALIHWHQRHRFCGACGAPTTVTQHGHRRQCTNPRCGIEHFPRTDPAIIVLVTADGGERALLGRQSSWPVKRWSTLAGFVEPGESLEDALRREVREEAGVVVGACRYYASQPWPFPASLMLGFHAEAIETTLTIGAELETAQWFEVDLLIEQLGTDQLRPPFPISISYALIRDWLLRQRGVELAELVAASRAATGAARAARRG
ncbi:MAG: NAD(+) diphosphatase [Xanthomonadales bacterium]|nr:NAD(+) diphosphatase [Xanthomonadales bacterium]